MFGLFMDSISHTVARWTGTVQLLPSWRCLLSYQFVTDGFADRLELLDRRPDGPTWFQHPTFIGETPIARTSPPLSSADTMQPAERRLHPASKPAAARSTNSRLELHAGQEKPFYISQLGSNS
jgi:hypothetical protein